MGANGCLIPPKQPTHGGSPLVTFVAEICMELFCSLKLYFGCLFLKGILFPRVPSLGVKTFMVI